MRPIDADVLIVELKKDEERFDREAEYGEQNPQNCTAGYAEAMWSRANGIRDAIISIYDAPTVDAVEVVRGEWIIKQKGFGIEAKVCSVCGIEKNNMSNFCPNCGADMREREGE